MGGDIVGAAVEQPAQLVTGDVQFSGGDYFLDFGQVVFTFEGAAGGDEFPDACRGAADGDLVGRFSGLGMARGAGTQLTGGGVRAAVGLAAAAFPHGKEFLGRCCLAGRQAKFWREQAGLNAGPDRRGKRLVVGCRLGSGFAGSRKD